MVFGITVFFNFLSLIFNPTLSLKDSDDLLIKTTLYMAAILLVFFIIFFILYSNSFFLKQRKHEIGIYIFLGVDNTHIAFIFAIEEFIRGSISLFLGLFCGVVFQKAFLMLLTKIGTFKTGISFHLSPAAIIITLIVFLLVFSLAGLIGFISIVNSKLIDLLNAEKHEEKLLKTRYFTGILSIFLIAAGFFFSRDIFSDAFFINGAVVMVSIILGTFLFFYSFLSMAIHLLTNNKWILYHGTNIISISNLSYRIKYNYRTLAFITLIVAATITAISTSISVQHIFNSTIKIAYPYSFSFISNDAGVKEKVLTTIQNSKHQVLLDIQTQYLLFDIQKNSQGSKVYPVIKLSDFTRIIKKLEVSNIDALLNDAKGLQNGAALSVASSNDRGFKNNQRLNMYGLNVKVNKTVNAPLLGTRFENNTIILTDNDYAQFLEKCQQLANPEKERTFNGILINNQEDSLELSKELATIPELKKNINSFIVYFNAYNEVTGVVKFTGIFLGLVFMLSTASIMYIKLMSDAIGDKQKYEILIKLGINDRELHQAVAKQVGLSYTFPLLIGTIYALMAIRTLQEFLNNYFEISLAFPFIIGVGIFSLVYALFYLLTTRKFINLVKSSL